MKRNNVDIINQHFKKRKKRTFLGMLVFFSLMLINCFVYFSGAETKDEEMVVVIDAGHGGNDPGKVSKDGIMEKDVKIGRAHV